MRRIYFFVEGQTEQTFVDIVLKPHLEKWEFIVHPPILTAHGRKNGKAHRGGVLKFLPMQKDIERILKQEKNNSDVVFTTMIDLYALPSDFPARERAEDYRIDPYRRVEALEEAWSEETDDRRFIPFIQLHEFEAYLFADISKIAMQINVADSKVANLQEIADEYESPELINDGQQTAPSKRIIAHIPEYAGSKVTVGPLTADEIGLEKIRSKCRHFASWLTRLEQLGTEE